MPTIRKLRIPKSAATKRVELDTTVYKLSGQPPGEYCCLVDKVCGVEVREIGTFDGTFFSSYSGNSFIPAEEIEWAYPIPWDNPEAGTEQRLVGDDEVCDEWVVATDVASEVDLKIDTTLLVEKRKVYARNRVSGLAMLLDGIHSAKGNLVGVFPTDSGAMLAAFRRNPDWQGGEILGVAERVFDASDLLHPIQLVRLTMLEITTVVFF